MPVALDRWPACLENLSRDPRLASAGLFFLVAHVPLPACRVAARAPAQRPARHTVVLSTVAHPARHRSGTMRDGRNRSTAKGHTMNAQLTVFDGFPYLMTRVVGCLYHVILLPKRWHEDDLVELSRLQAFANQLPTCLVLAIDRAIYFNGKDDGFECDQPPVGGILITSRLLTPVECEDGSEELHIRQARLLRLVNRSSRYVVGDPTKGGRKATPEELTQLDGFQSDGTPCGLTRCGVCGDWQGICLDPSQTFAGMVMTVVCRCANTNRCARCHQLLYDRRLNANYFAPDKGAILHVPGFCGLSHQCRPEVSSQLCA